MEHGQGRPHDVTAGNQEGGERNPVDRRLSELISNSCRSENRKFKQLDRIPIHETKHLYSA